VLLIETDRAPYVVRNPQFGKQLLDAKKPAGENKVWMPIEWEVPWRRLESTESATRLDLLKLLVPSEALPECELLEGQMSAQTNVNGTMFAGSLDIYVSSRTGRQVVFPKHRCKVEFRVGTEEALTRLGIDRIIPNSNEKRGGMPNDYSTWIIEGPGETIIKDPGKVRVLFAGNFKKMDDLSHDIEVVLTLRTTMSDSQVVVRAPMGVDKSPSPGNVRNWRVTPKLY